MTLPTFIAFNSDAKSSGTTTGVTLPVADPDQLLLCIGAWDKAQPGPSLTGFTQIGSLQAGGAGTLGVALAVFAKAAVGGDTTAITGQNSTTDARVLGFYQIENWSGQLSDIKIAQTTGVNPPALTPTGSAGDYLWIAAAAWSYGAVSTAAPTGYTGLQALTAGTVGSAGSAPYVSAHRIANGTTEDPSGFTGQTPTGTIFSCTIGVLGGPYPMAVTKPPGNMLPYLA